MCANMKEFQVVSEKLFDLQQKKAKKKREMDALEKEIEELKSEASIYMKKRQKDELVVAGLTVMYTAYTKPSFDKDAFIAGEKDGKNIYEKYSKKIQIERITVRVSK